jgi:hypothetical protein
MHNVLAAVVKKCDINVLFKIMYRMFKLNLGQLEKYSVLSITLP